MPKYLVTVQQHVLEEKHIEIEAEDEAQAADLVYDSADFRDGDGFEFHSIPDKWIGSVVPWMDRGELESESSASSIELDGVYKFPEE